MRICIAIHASKEACYQAGVAAGLVGEAAERFTYAGYEHTIEYEVDTRTGKAVAVKIDGREIAK